MYLRVCMCYILFHGHWEAWYLFIKPILMMDEGCLKWKTQDAFLFKGFILSCSVLSDVQKRKKKEPPMTAALRATRGMLTARRTELESSESPSKLLGHCALDVHSKMGQAAFADPLYKNTQFPSIFHFVIPQWKTYLHGIKTYTSLSCGRANP